MGQSGGGAGAKKKFGMPTFGEGDLKMSPAGGMASPFSFAAPRPVEQPSSESVRGGAGPPAPMFFHNRRSSTASESDIPTTSSYFTPQPKLVKPDRSAFHSTGFLSKKNRPRPVSTQPMPETPLKKGVQSFSFPGMSNHPTPLSLGVPPTLKLDPGTPGFGVPATPRKAPPSSIGSRKHRSPFSESPGRSNKKPHLSVPGDVTPPSRRISSSPYPQLLDEGRDSSPTQPGMTPRRESIGSFSSPGVETRLLQMRLSTPRGGKEGYGENSTPSTGSPTESSVSRVGLWGGRNGGLINFRAALELSGDVDMMDCDDELPTPRHEGPTQRQPARVAYNHLVTPYPRFLMADYFERLRERNGRPPSPDAIAYTQEHADYFDANFRIVRLLGSGSFADAYQVQSKTDGQFYAIKKTRTPFAGYKDGLKRLEEVETLWRVDGVVRKRKSYLEEYCQNSPIDEYRIWHILAEITLGLKHIHDLEMVHLDIKPDNILITADGSLKIADFGLATKAPVPRGEDREGDRTYIAPELFRDTVYGKPADIYSLGLIVLEITANIILPENGPEWQKLREGDVAEISFGNVTPDLIHLIKLMLAPDPSARLTVAAILSHPMLQSIVSKEVVSGALEARLGM
ncbi:hypothetical protein HK104_002286 [Borealophlyctis nickersoniae]|nr:hypothetical protein HK104_002286 [Borealophlyctis nickersoniae]